MSAPSLSIAFGYDQFYADYLSVPWNRELMERSSALLPHPSQFSARNPRDCCLLALHGHIIYPPDEQAIKERVKDSAPYSKTVATRMKLFEGLVEDFNAQQQRMKLLFGGAIKIVIDDGPVLDSSFPLEAYGGAHIVEAAPQYERDRKFLKLGKAGRLNHFAREYGFDHFEELRSFVAALDKEAQAMGYPSYGAICVPTRYLEHVQRQLTNDPRMRPTLLEVTEKRTLLQQQTVFTIERFVTCREAAEVRDFFVDVTSEGVLISLLSGTSTNTGIVSSKHMSDRSGDFHRTWFA